MLVNLEAITHAHTHTHTHTQHALTHTTCTHKHAALIELVETTLPPICEERGGGRKGRKKRKGRRIHKRRGRVGGGEGPSSLSLPF